MTIALDHLPAEDFEMLAGQALRAWLGDAPVELQLTEVLRSPYATGRPLPGFALRLLGPREPWLTQGMLALEHPRHGRLELFATTIDRDARGTRYEIVFN